MTIRFIQKIKNLALTAKDWLSLYVLESEFKKEVDQNVDTWSNRDTSIPLEQEQENQQKYTNGIGLIKRRLKDQMKGGKTFDETMGQYTGDDPNFFQSRDLLGLATDEDQRSRSFRKLRESAVVYSGADVKTEEDKTKMIDKRIGHYTDLQIAKMSREHLRRARDAHQAGDLELHKILMEEWNQVYGQRRTN